AGQNANSAAIANRRLIVTLPADFLSAADTLSKTDRGTAMDRLWAPWRLAYVADPQEKAKPPTADACFICTAVAGSDDRANLLVDRTPLSVVMLNKFPYNNGHLLIAPKEHRGRLDELSPEQLLDLQLSLRKMLGIVEANAPTVGDGAAQVAAGDR